MLKSVDFVQVTEEIMSVASQVFIGYEYSMQMENGEGGEGVVYIARL